MNNLMNESQENDSIKSNQSLLNKSPLNIEIDCSSPRKKICKFNNIQIKTNDINVKEDSLTTHWWFTDYAEDIEKYLREKENDRLVFFSQSPQATYRQHLIDFIKTVGENETLSRTTIHLGVYILDVFMDNHNIALERLNLLALVCLLLASKLEEKEQKVPKLSELNNIINNQYPLSDFTALEIMVLKFFDWKIIIPTAANFIEYYICDLITLNDYNNYLINCMKQKNSNCSNNNNLLQLNNICDMRSTAMILVFELLDLTLSDRNFVHDSPSKVAAACLCATRRLMNIMPEWSTHLFLLTSYKESELDNLTIKLIQWRTSVIIETTEIHKRKTPDSGYLSDVYKAEDDDEDGDDDDDEDEEEAEEDEDDEAEDDDDDEESSCSPN